MKYVHLIQVPPSGESVTQDLEAALTLSVNWGSTVVVGVIASLMVASILAYLFSKTN